LGPLLFLIYINDISDNLETCSFIFADDTMLLEVVDNSISSAEVLNRDLNKNSQWADKWLVTMNPSITRSMTFSITKDKLNHPIISMVVCGCPIEEVVTQPHLGLNLQNNMSWKSQQN
jgi:hypothetical protein